PPRSPLCTYTTLFRSKPKPPEAGEPEIDIKATGTAEIIAVKKHGTKIIGRLNKLGIIIFIAPKAIAIVTPGLLTFHEFTTSTSVVAATPIAAAPAAKPLTWIAIAIATVEIGEIINTAKEQAIKIHIKPGCNSVN